MAQGSGAPADTAALPIWVSASFGAMRGTNISDKASHGGWHLNTSSPVAVAASMPLWGRTVGVRVQASSVNMRFSGPSCASCAARVMATTTLGTMNVTNQIGSSAFNTEFEVGLGVTSWTGLRVDGGSSTNASSAVHDFTLALSGGVSRILSDRFDALLMVDLLSMSHPLAPVTESGLRTGGQLTLYAARLGARLRIGH